ncbi:copper amine oxidase N-terminal domain-containing protein [Ammoniphilus sp. CFH 90114]|uniref:copper amine oxidase N-terminal domain-containing protein n=1 Tax=Ammoniphilus sp. CFH 90114 TaxID=2493665 RepID=UPI00100E841A|nr:copper amine oxidase N-terminal domain-containing protein [Ammoniphilus sp. CFH 90114]RXT03990.1 hypothetical protein EIZ39_21765 [Ammoniphilus sp. CFH 90114]
MKKHWKPATMGILAASLIFSQGAFAQGNQDKGKANNGKSVEVTTTVNASVTTDVYTEKEEATNEKFIQKIDRIKEKLDQFSQQEVPGQALEGKLGSIQNRVDALKGQLDELAKLQEELDTLEGEEAEVAVGSLAAVYVELGKLEEALKVQQDYAKKLHTGTDEEILKQYKEVGKLMKQMGKVGVKALVNGVEPEMDVMPTIENGRTLVPFRALAEALGAEVVWNAETRTVTVTKDGVSVVITIDSMEATVDGQEYTLDVPAKINKGRTVIPLRFLSESLKAKVLWEQETQTVVVIGDTAKEEVADTEETTVNAEATEEQTQDETATETK